jgi:hypothetical protein
VKRIILALVASLAVLIGGTLPASAAPGFPVTHWRFWSSDICMAIGDTSLNAGAIAAKWNAQSIVNIHTANNCVTAGYPPSRRFTIDTINRPYDACAFAADINGYMLTPGTGDGNDNPNNPDLEYLYSNNPRAYVNTNSKCVDDHTNVRIHYVSMAIGMVLGLDSTNSTGYNSRVMNLTDYSLHNIPYPDANSGGLLNLLYTQYCNEDPRC